jgi:hypothetical protein
MHICHRQKQSLHNIAELISDFLHRAEFTDNLKQASDKPGTIKWGNFVHFFGFQPNNIDTYQHF